MFDTNAFSQLVHCYYPSGFPTLWANFQDLLDAGQITSTREAARECADGPEALRDWAGNHAQLFPAPTAREGEFVRKIFARPRFRHVIEERKLLKGGKNADPFVVARAAALGATVVTAEKNRPNSARIPNICEHFGIAYTSFEGFMELEGWRF